MLQHNFFMLLAGNRETLQCIEYINVLSLYRLVCTPNAADSQVLALLEKIDPDLQSGYAAVYHDWKQGTNAPYGRYYSSGALISQKKSNRSILCADRYVELDICSCNPTLLYNVMKRLGHDLPALQTYILSKEDAVTKIHAEVPEPIWACRLDGETISVKRFVNASMNGSNAIYHLFEPHLDDNSYTKTLKEEFDFARSTIFNHFSEVPYRADGFDSTASRMTNLLQTMECDIVVKVMEHLVEKGYILRQGNYIRAGYAYDGILIEKLDSLDLNEVECAANEFLQNLGYEGLRMRQKELGPSDANGLLDVVHGHCRLDPLDEHEENKLLIRSPTGSGKTFQSLQYALANFTTTLVIVHRQMLATDICTNYPVFKSYLGDRDAASNLEADFLVVCINSLDKLPDPGKYKCVICDEVSSVMRQVVEMNVSTVAIELFGKYATHPDVKFIGMDALLCERDIEYWQREVASDVHVKIVSPPKLCMPRKHCWLYESEQEFCQKMVEDIAQGKRVCLAYSISIDAVNGILDSTGVEYLNVNRFTKRDSNIDEWEQYQVVAFSPTMDAGVDVSFVDESGERVQHFDVVYGLFNAANTTPKQAVQMLGRVRDCTQYNVFVRGSYKGRVFDNEAEFVKYVQSRIMYVHEFGLDCHLDDAFKPDIIRNLRFRLTWNSVHHRKSSQQYQKYLRKFLFLNQWSFSSAEPIESNELLSLRQLVKRGTIAETRQIASSPIIDDETAQGLLGQDNDLASHRKLMAWSVNRGFGLDIDRPPPPPSWLEDGTVRENREYVEQLQQKQLQDLYPYDENGKQMGFDYVREYKKNSQKYFRQKHLVDIENDRAPTLHFALHKTTYSETSYHCSTMIKLLGFNELSSTIPVVHRSHVENNVICQSILRDDSVFSFLAKQCDIHVKKIDGLFRLCTRITSPNHEDVGAFYLENSPFYYLAPDSEGLTRSGNAYKCETCGRRVARTSLSDHQCPPLPEHVEYRHVQGEVRKWCTMCDVDITRNTKRHCDRHGAT